MRKNYDEDEPGQNWSDREILTWVNKNGVLNEAQHISDEEKGLNKSSGSSKRPK